MREFNLQESALVYGTEHGWYARRVRWGGRRGAPDTVFIKDGRHVWIEFKREDGEGEVAVAQSRESKRLQQHGAESYIVDSWDDFIRILNGPLQETNTRTKLRQGNASHSRRTA